MKAAIRSSVRSNRRLSKPDRSDPLPLAGKRIGLISSWVSRRNGGVFEAVARQAAIVDRLGGEAVILGLRDEHSGEDAWRFGNGALELVQPAGPKAIGYSPDLGQMLASAELDLLHCHGIWQMHVHAARQWAARTGGPLVISPHGMLDPWITRRNQWKKRLARIGWERAAWRSSALFHALTDDERADILREYRGAQVDVIPNPAPRSSGHRTGFPAPVALYLGRVHEKKNIGALIAGWKRAYPRLPTGSQLVIAGWGDVEAVSELEGPAGADQSISYVGAAFGAQKAALFDISRFLVLPSLSEGLPMAVLEAWAAGVPSIMSNHCHLPGGFEAGAAIASGTDPESIAAGLIEGFAKDAAAWRLMSNAARKLAEGPYGEASVSARWADLYGRLCG